MQKKDFDRLSLDNLKNIYQHIDANGYEILEDEILRNKNLLIEVLFNNLKYWSAEENCSICELLEQVKKNRPFFFIEEKASWLPE